MDRSKIFLACAFGGGVGAFVALQIWYPLWWLGLIIGGLVGYFSYEFNEVLAAARIAWHRVVGYRPPRQKIVQVFLGAILAVNVVASFFGIVGALVLLAAVMSRIWLKLPDWGAGVELSLMFFFATALAAAIVDVERPYRAKHILFLNPVATLIYWPGWLVAKAIQGGIKYAPSTLRKMATFLKTVCLMIHSDLRLLCGLDAALGAAIGYFMGSAIIGAISGGIVGVLNFEIISKRVLKIVSPR